jgi:hypothetical protein
MMPAEGKSYLDQCIAALPPEKREAARRAFYEISETGDDSYLSKLLAVLEANGAYARKVPKEMTEAGAKVVREMEIMFGRVVEFEKYRRDAFQRTITDEGERLADSLPVREINAGIARQNELLDRLDKLYDKIDQGVSGGACFLLAMGAFIGGIVLTTWLFWGEARDSREAKSFWDAAAQAGLHLEIKNANDAPEFTVTGPPMILVTRLSRQGTECGVTIDFAKPQ